MRAAMCHIENWWFLIVIEHLSFLPGYLTAGGVSASIHPTVSAVSICKQKVVNGRATSSAIRTANVHRHVIRDEQAPLASRGTLARGGRRLSQYCKILMIHCWSQTGERFAISRCSCARRRCLRTPLSYFLPPLWSTHCDDMMARYLFSRLRLFVKKQSIFYYMRWNPLQGFYGTTQVISS